MRSQTSALTPISTKRGQARVRDPRPAVRRARLAGALGTLLDAVGALEADRGRAHAVRADRPVAPLAPDPGLPVGVAVADRWGVRDAPGAARPSDRRGGHPRSISTVSMTTGSTGRSPGPVGGGADGVDDVAALLVGDLTEDGVLVGQPAGGRGGDEELRAVGARAGVGHREQVGAVEGELGVELVLERVAGATGAGAERAAALEHEAVDDAVEAEAVVVALTRPAGVVVVVLGALREAGEVLHGLGRVVGEEVQHDVATVGLQRGLEVGHDSLSRACEKRSRSRSCHAAPEGQLCGPVAAERNGYPPTTC